MLALTYINREVTEWLKVLAWKVSVPQKGTGGSNPFLSALNLTAILYYFVNLF